MLEHSEEKLRSTSEANLNAKIHLACKQKEVPRCRPMKATTTTCLLHTTGVHNTKKYRLFLQRTVEAL